MTSYLMFLFAEAWIPPMKESKNKMAAGSVELDPVFLKAIKLLHSRHPDSLDQLRILRDDAIKQHNQPTSSTIQEKAKDTKTSKILERRPSTITSTYETKTTSKAKEKKPIMPSLQTREVDSSKIETVEDLGSSEGATIETVDDMGSCVVETIEEFSSSTLIEQPSKKPRLKINVEIVFDEEALKSTGALPVEDLTIDLGIKCTVCTRSESKQVGNKLVECHECHSHFHQKCHEPRISDQDANDLRLVWYCHQCTRKMREMSTSSVSKAKTTENSSNSRTSFTGAALNKPPKLQSFQRLSTSDSKPFSPSPTSQSFAIPGLTGASGSAASSKQPLPGTSSTQKTSMQSAMKRLQMVKKKAAQKNLNQQQMRVIRR